MKRFRKAANKLEALKTIYLQLSKTFLSFRKRFPKQFYNNSSGVSNMVLGQSGHPKTLKAR
jgi:hypothetical protein